MTKIKIAGFGGQGVILAGELLAYAAVIEGKEGSAIGSYGSAARGGLT
ncbi:MAG: 2-oxoacid:acceptor oxidoreductase family protein, partial [candidate division WOR-3 bacterium]